MRRPEAGPADDQSRRGGPVPDREDDLPGGLPFPQGTRDPRTAPAVRGRSEGPGDQPGAAGSLSQASARSQRPLLRRILRRRGSGAGRLAGAVLRDRRAADGAVYGGLVADLRHLSEIREQGGRDRLLHRRGLHRRNGLSADLQNDSRGAGDGNDPGGALYHGHHGDRRDRDESLSGEGRDGRGGKAHGAGRERRPHGGAGRAELSQTALGPQAADGYLAHRPRHRPEARGQRHAHPGRRGADVGHEDPRPGRAGAAPEKRERRADLPQRRGSALPSVRGQRRAADRPRLGLGALHGGRHQAVPTRQQQSRQRSGPARAVFRREGADHRHGNGGRSEPGAGPKGPCRRPDRAQHRLRPGEPDGAGRTVLRPRRTRLQRRPQPRSLRQNPAEAHRRREKAPPAHGVHEADRGGGPCHLRRADEPRAAGAPRQRRGAERDLRGGGRGHPRGGRKAPRAAQLLHG